MQHLSQNNGIQLYLRIVRLRDKDYVNADVSYSAAQPSSGTKAAVIRGDAAAAQ